MCCAKDKIFGNTSEAKEDEDKSLKDLDLKTIWMEIIPYQIYIQEQAQREEVLNQLEEQLKKVERLEQEYINRQGYKYYVLFLVSICVGLILYFWFIPLMDFLVLKSEPNSVL